MGISYNLKTFYRSSLLERLVQHVDGGASFEDFRPTLLDAVILLKTAWEKIEPATVINCFRKAGFSAVADPPIAPSAGRSDEIVRSEIEPLLSRLYSENLVEASDFVSVDEDVMTGPLLTQTVMNEEPSDDAEQDDLGPALPDVNFEMLKLYLPGRPPDGGPARPLYLLHPAALTGPGEGGRFGCIKTSGDNKHPRGSALKAGSRSVSISPLSDPPGQEPSGEAGKERTAGKGGLSGTTSATVQESVGVPSQVSTTARDGSGKKNVRMAESESSKRVRREKDRYGAESDVDINSIDSIWSIPEDLCSVGLRTGETSPPRPTPSRRSCRHYRLVNFPTLENTMS
ncbi:tigger transposable element-derived protein 6 [Elysia marginata]|uniref:Tigger transposable element-derived protein 6 n=1 Tax=Elysia marginata TaxID=1093978 RepID=A0AAV4J6R1_9GAST|nr:tigger transposable element-derived protein 6 [Elysia marginata]